MHVATLVIELHLPGCRSLKQKRGRLKPLLARLQKQFNISTAEIGRNDNHQAAVIACAAVANDQAHLERVLRSAVEWIAVHRPDLQIVDDRIEFI